MTSILRFPITVENTVIHLDPTDPAPVTLAVDETGLAAYIGGDGSITPVGYTAGEIEGVDIGTENLQVLLLRVLLRVGDVLRGTRNAELFDLYRATDAAAREIAAAASGSVRHPTVMISTPTPGTRNMLHIEFGFAAGREVVVKFTNSNRTPRTPLDYRLGDLRLTGIMTSYLVDALNGLDGLAMQHPGMPSDEASDAFHDAIVASRPSQSHKGLTTHMFRTPPLAGVTLTGEQARLMCGRTTAGYNTWAPPADLRGATVIADDGRRPFLPFYLGDRINGATFTRCSIAMHDLRGKDVTFDRCRFTEVCGTVLRSPVMRDCEFGHALVDGLAVRGMTIVGTITGADTASVSGLTLDGDDVDDLQALVDQTMKLNANGDDKADGDGNVDDVEAGGIDENADGENDSATAAHTFELTLNAKWIRDGIREAYLNGDGDDQTDLPLLELPTRTIHKALYRCIDDDVRAVLNDLRSNVIDMLRRRVDPAD